MEIFRRSLNEAISLTAVDATLKATSMSTDGIASFGFPRNIFFKRNVGYIAYAGYKPEFWKVFQKNILTVPLLGILCQSMEILYLHGQSHISNWKT